MELVYTGLRRMRWGSMRKLSFTLLAIVLTGPVAMAGEVSQGVAQGASTSGPAWYQVVTGIVAIPAALLGIILSWNIMQKTRLESKKLELEITEKQPHLFKESTGPNFELLAGTFSDGQRALLLVVRYVLLQITLQLWAIVPYSITIVISGLAFGAYGIFYLFQGDLSAPYLSPVAAAVVIMPQAVNFTLGVVRWLIVFGFGWPLFKDTCAFLNIPVKSLFDIPRMAKTGTRLLPPLLRRGP